MNPGSSNAIELPVKPAALPHEHASGFSLAPLWTLYALTFRQHLHGRRWMVMGVLFLLPAALAVLIRATAAQVPTIGMEFLLAFMFIPQALLPLVALVYSSGIIQDEQEEQTLTYLLIRPISRWAIYAVKLLATITTTVLLTTIFTALTYAVIYIGTGTEFAEAGSRCLKAVVLHDAAVIAYCCLFGLISLLTRYALIVGILYTAIFEGLVANLPFSFRLLTVIYYSRIIAYRWPLDFKITEYGRTEDVSAVAWQLDVAHDQQLEGHPSLRVCMLVLAAASVVCAIVASFICSRREFHVKTPEGS